MKITVRKIRAVNLDREYIIEEEDEMTFDEQLKKLANKIRATRKDKGLTLQEAATRGGWKHKQNWVHLEKGNGMTHRTLTRIAKALDVSVAELINGGE